MSSSVFLINASLVTRHSTSPKKQAALYAWIWRRTFPKANQLTKCCNLNGKRCEWTSEDSKWNWEILLSGLSKHSRQVQTLWLLVLRLDNIAQTLSRSSLHWLLNIHNTCLDQCTIHLVISTIHYFEESSTYRQIWRARWPKARITDAVLTQQSRPRDRGLPWWWSRPFFFRMWLENIKEPSSFDSPLKPNEWLQIQEALCYCILSQCMPMLRELAPCSKEWVPLNDYLHTPYTN